MTKKSLPLEQPDEQPGRELVFSGASRPPGGLVIARTAAQRLTSLHPRVFERRLRAGGAEKLTRDVPGLSPAARERLDERGVVRKGIEVKPGDVLVGCVRPYEPLGATHEERMLHAIGVGNDVADVSLRVPPEALGTVVARLKELGAPAIILLNEQELLQRCVDALVQNHLERRPIKGYGKRPLRSLSQGLTAHLTALRHGRHLDYSGVGVVVPSPCLAVDRVRIPRSMATELFKPWLYFELEKRGYVETIKAAKAMVAAGDPRVPDALDAVIDNRPLVVFPHRIREGAEPAVAAFNIEIWDEHALGLAPAAASALGIAFDGSKAIVHLPIDPRAIEEAQRLKLDKPFARDVVYSRPKPSGWLGRAALADDPIASLTRAALGGEIDSADDPFTRSLVGRLSLMKGIRRT